MHELPGAILAPHPKVVVHHLPRRQVMGKQAPRTPTAQDREDAVENFALGVFLRAPSAPGLTTCRKAVAAVIMLTMSNSVIVKKGRYLCIAEHATEFRYDEPLSQWINAIFRAVHKYIILTSDETEIAFQITEVGRENPTYLIPLGFDVMGSLICQTTLVFPKTTGNQNVIAERYPGGPGVSR
jgi:hypothetical protein